ncbi:Tim44/TimA family putative adaptor protein [Mesorhizobium sp. NPDC059054]|uniref:Tim44/TimA family putative adaptor protein n=1 Tax=Mesorhizobium sp. NPDC059054 TaxID=3346711 RepID=UPI0036C81583
MNEVSTLATNFPAIIILSTWLVILSVLVGYSTSSDADEITPLSRNTISSDKRSVEDEQNWTLLREVDPEFSPSWFLIGAQSAYEKIVEAYARGDMETLRPLLSAQVLDTFATVIAERNERQGTAELVVLGIDLAEIERVALLQDAVEVEVMFHAQLIEATGSSADDVVLGGPTRPILVADRWTFSRPIPSRDPSWTLVATQEGIQGGGECR